MADGDDDWLDVAESLGVTDCDPDTDNDAVRLMEGVIDWLDEPVKLEEADELGVWDCEAVADWLGVPLRLGDPELLGVSVSDADDDWLLLALPLRVTDCDGVCDIDGV